MRPTDVREQSVCCRVSKRKTFIHFSFHTDRSKLLTPIYFLYLLYLLDLAIAKVTVLQWEGVRVDSENPRGTEGEKGVCG